MELLSFVQAKINEDNVEATAVVPPSLILSFFDQYRILNYADAVRYCPSDENFEVDEDTNQVTITMLDLFGTKRYYASRGNFYLNPQLIIVSDGTTSWDVGESGAPFIFDAAQCNVDFTAALTGSPEVTVQGHLINIFGAYGVMWACWEVLFNHFSKLASTRGREFDALRSNARKMMGHYGSSIVRG